MQRDEYFALCPVGIELFRLLGRVNLLWLVLHLLTPQLPKKRKKRHAGMIRSKQLMLFITLAVHFGEFKGVWSGIALCEVKNSLEI